MPIQPSQETLTREQIIDIIHANAQLYKNEPDFASYIAELAMYLLENHYDQILKKKSEAQANPARGERTLPAGIPKEFTDSRLNSYARARKALREAYDTQFDTRKCPNCGARVTGAKCVACGAILT